MIEQLLGSSTTKASLFTCSSNASLPQRTEYHIALILFKYNQSGKENELPYNTENIATLLIA